MPHRRLVVLAEIALTLALAYVLGLLKVWQMPQGGEVSLAMLPLFVLALRRGLPVGLVAGLLYGLLDLTYTAPHIYHWVQFFLDYPLAYMAVGLAGVFAPALRNALARSRRDLAIWGAIVPGIALGAAGRFAFHLVSGVVFFSEWAKGQPVWLYSAAYNSFVFVSAVACAFFAVLILLALQRVLPVEGE